MPWTEEVLITNYMTYPHTICTRHNQNEHWLGIQTNIQTYSLNVIIYLITDLENE